MNCEHEVRFTIKPTDDACRFHFDVRTYKDRIVAPDEYSGATTVTPSDDTQTLPTKDKTVRSDITVLPAPTEPLATNENGTFTPSDGVVGFSEVTVDIVPALDSLTVTENGLYLPESGVDGYDRVSVDVPWPSGSMTITENGTYDVAGYASAVVDVNVVPDLRPLSVSENGQYSPDGFDGYSNVAVDVPSEVTFDGIADGSQPSGDITITVTEVVAGAFRDKTAITGVSAPNCTTVQNNGFTGCSGVTKVYLPKLETVGNNGFTNIKATNIVLPAIKTTGSGAFASSAMVRHMCIGEHIETIGASCMNNMSAGWSVKIKGKPTSIATTAFPSNSAGDIYVPWSQGEVANAPWGATRATIHYDTIYDEEWNVISST